MKVLVPLVIGCGLVGVVAVVLAIVGWDWMWWVVANGVLTALLLVLFRGSVTGADADRPPGVARVSAARWAGPLDPDTLGEEEARLEPDPDVAQGRRGPRTWTPASPFCGRPPRLRPRPSSPSSSRSRLGACRPSPSSSRCSPSPPSGGRSRAGARRSPAPARRARPGTSDLRDPGEPGEDDRGGE